MANILRKGYSGMSISDTSTHRARMDATAVLAAKMVENLEGNTNPLFEHIQEMMLDPERLAAVTLSITNLFFAWATSNGTDVKPMAKIIEWNVKALRDDKQNVRVKRG